jgi:hypothetical protein
VNRPYRRHLRYLNRFRDLRGQDHPDVERRILRRLERLRHLGEERRILGVHHLGHLPDEHPVRHLGDLVHPDEYLEHHLGDLDQLHRLGAGPDGPFPG